MIVQGLLSLAELAEREQRPAEELQVPFAARIDGEAVEVTAVLERTAVVYASGSRHGDGRLAGHGRVFVDPALPWGPRVSEAERKAKRFNVWRLDRALADQAKPRTVKVKAPRPSARPAIARDPEPATPAKTCSGCGNGIRANNASGLCRACKKRCPLCGGKKSIGAKACMTCMPPAASGARSWSTRERPAPKPELRCPQCGEVKPREEFSPGQSWCKRCKRALDNARNARRAQARAAAPMLAESPACVYCGRPSPCGCPSARVAAGVSSLVLATLQSSLDELAEQRDNNQRLRQYAQELEDELAAWRSAASTQISRMNRAR